MAVKQLECGSKLVEEELQVLRQVADHAVPRVVATLDEERDEPKSVYVVLE